LFQAIVAASDLPLSIIIVGVGEADFEAMDELVSNRLTGDRFHNQCDQIGRNFSNWATLGYFRLLLLNQLTPKHAVSTHVLDLKLSFNVDTLAFLADLFKNWVKF
jgi:hypothetical protein